MIGVALDTYQLTLRSLREVWRQPAFELQNYFIPLEQGVDSRPRPLWASLKACPYEPG